MTQETDWRLQGQEAYLSGLEWEKRDYFQYREGWDHDHCEFCGIKLAVGAKYDGSIAHGYTAREGYYCVCEQCFSDFKERFKWKALSVKGVGTLKGSVTDNNDYDLSPTLLSSMVILSDRNA